MYWFGASLLRGIRQPAARDRNLRDEPAFFNAAEAGRLVYVAPEAIDSASGLPALAASRRFARFGTVRELTAMGRSEAAPYTPRHIAHLSAEWRPSLRFSLGAVARLTSGLPFTPLVSGDVNGDGALNDRAFVFSPDAAARLDPEFGRGVARLLNTSPAHVRACLQPQVGSIAAHNSCRTPGSATLDLRARLGLVPRAERTNRRIVFWVVAHNVTAGLDYLLHGPARLSGWGQYPAVDTRLLSVQGFDVERRQFVYAANPGFGMPIGPGIRQSSPFMLSIQARVVIGTDRVQRDVVEQLNARSNRVEMLTPENVRLHIEQQLPVLPLEVLALNGPKRLYLTPAQALPLQALADTLGPRIGRLTEELVDAVATRSAGAPAVRAQPLQVLVNEAVALRATGIAAVQSILSEAQWAALPGWLREAPRGLVPFPPEMISSGPDY